MKPRIGISMKYRTNEDDTEWAYLDHRYFDVIADLGVIPIPIVPVENIVTLNAILSQVNGVIFTGGGDLNPALYDEQAHKKTNIIHPRRQRFELLLYEQTIKQRLPVLGISLGIQLINVAQGGSLHQHLPDLDSEVDHGTSDKYIPNHLLTLHKKSKLYNWLKVEQISVPSCHHQGINRLGKGLLPAAVAEDGLVEVIELSDYPFLLAVQWHPERDIEMPGNRLIFNKFIDAVRACGD
jgi:putative glutamine amidotransferase